MSKIVPVIAKYVGVVWIDLTTTVCGSITALASRTTIISWLWWVQLPASAGYLCLRFLISGPNNNGTTILV